MYSKGTSRALAALSLLAGWVSGCDAPTITEERAPVATAAAVAGSHGHAGVAMTKGVEDQLAVVRQATARFQQFDAAQDAGFTVKVTDCWEKQPEGAMGFHYANATRIDGAVEVANPEVLLFERQDNGRMRLVGVEWIIPFEQWHSDAPPVLMGIPLVKNFTFNVWALHAWIWKRNPKGMFFDWNPNVHCQ